MKFFDRLAIEIMHSNNGYVTRHMGERILISNSSKSERIYIRVVNKFSIFNWRVTWQHNRWRKRQKR